MFDIEMHEVSKEFSQCWQAAGRHLQARTGDGQLGWLKADLTPPFLEHLSFRMGNQLYFIRIEDVDGRVTGPGNTDGFRIIAEGCNGIPCRMPMRCIGSTWSPLVPGWGLIHATTGRSIDPTALISEEKVEMTDWEVHDFAVQVVRDHVTKELGRELMSSQGNPQVNPSIWFVGDNGPEWIVVRCVRFPERKATMPDNIADIAANCARLSAVGHFASVAVANSGDSCSASNKVPTLPLYRGHGIFVAFEGLIPLSDQFLP